MRALKLDYPVTLPDGTELLPAGTELTTEIMTALIREVQDKSYPAVRLFDYGTVSEDVRRFCNHPPYDRIFSDPSRIETLLALMKQVELVEPLLEFLDYFKIHDDYTYRHILVVFALSTFLAQDLITDPELLAQEAMAAPTHDFGKICVPLSVLKKETPLSPSERGHLGHHSVAGYVLLSYYLKDPDSPAAIVARDHHERCDGSGYPMGTPLNSRMVEIVAVCDVFDALIAQRPYRPTSYDVRTALEEITEMAQKGQFNWYVVKALVGYNRKDRPHYTHCRISREKRGAAPVDNRYVGFSRKRT